LTVGKKVDEMDRLGNGTKAFEPWWEIRLNPELKPEMKQGKRGRWEWLRTQGLHNQRRKEQWKQGAQVVGA
jgi:hypothetical protein